MANQNFIEFDCTKDFHLRTQKIGHIAHWVVQSLTEKLTEQELRVFVNELRRLSVSLDPNWTIPEPDAVYINDCDGLVECERIFENIHATHGDINFCLIVFPDFQTPFYAWTKDICNKLDITKQGVVDKNILSFSDSSKKYLLAQINKKVYDWSIGNRGDVGTSRTRNVASGYRGRGRGRGDRSSSRNGPRDGSSAYGRGNRGGSFGDTNASRGNRGGSFGDTNASRGNRGGSFADTNASRGNRGGSFGDTNASRGNRGGSFGDTNAGRRNRGGSVGDTNANTNVMSDRGGRPILRGSRGNRGRGRGNDLMHISRNLISLGGTGYGGCPINTNIPSSNILELERQLANSCTISSRGPQGDSNSAVAATTGQQPSSNGMIDSQNVSNETSNRTKDHRKTFPMGFEKLNEYIGGPSNELVLHLTCGEAFKLLLNRSSIKAPNNPGIVFEDSILTALAKALDSKLLSVRQNQNELISIVLDSTYFRSILTTRITEWLVNVSAITPRSRPAYVANINNCCNVLFNLMELRHSACSNCAANVTLLKTLLETLHAGYSDTYNNVDDQLATSHINMVEKFDELLVRQQEKSSNVMTSRKDVLPNENDPPPNDFRELSVVPTIDDINAVKWPFLRSNRDKGGYDDVNHYLDVQFRLLREDCICPIRRGVQAFKNMGELSHKHSQDITLYKGTYILSPEITKNGQMVYWIQFDVKQFRRAIKWEVSKRLIFGSLLCLSHDMFETIIFATVFDRNPKELANGYLKVSFESEFQLADGYSKEYIMAESGAYFEAYRHVLSGLQKMPVDGFPMERYLVHCQTDLQHPAYLRYDGIRRSPRYQMKLKSSSKSVIPQSVAVDILEPRRWPSRDKLGLDEKQYDALKLAITSEFALIQGPPGTGKTFIGYNIVQLLLDNSNVWSDTQIRNIPNAIRRGAPPMPRNEVIVSPILVLCYTNHALDQFLEGVADFMPTGIVRVGGRCKNDNLTQYLLREVMRNSKTELPGDVRRQFYHFRDRKMQIDKQIQEASIRHKMPFQSIMQYDCFKSYMTPPQIDCFEQYVFIKVNQYHVQCDCNNALWDWLFHDFELGIVVSPSKQAQPIAQVNVSQNDLPGNISDDDNESIDFEDIEQERYLDDDDSDEVGDVHLQHMLNQIGHERETFQQRQAREETELKRYQTMFETATKLHEHQVDGWADVNAQKEREKYIAEMLAVTQKFFLRDEALPKTDLWRMSHDDRWKLYRYWVLCYVGNVSQLLSGLQTEQIELQKRLDELRQFEQLHVLKRARIIGMTTTGAAKYQGLLQEVGAKIIIIEEAAEVLEAHLVTSLSSKCEHLILIGDHFQLRPNPTVYELAKKYKLEISLFERMINNGLNCATLAFQHRMRPEIADLLMPHFYNELHNADNVYNYPDVNGMVKNMFFIQHSNNEANEGDTRSHKNDYESKYLVNLCRYLLQQGYIGDQITILTPYTGQMFNIKRQMEKIIPKSGVRVTPVDNYQGEENDIILLSLVRSNKEMKIGFMNTKNRVCVALSRAKLGLYVIGNFDLFAEVNKDFWAPICADLKKRSFLSNEVEICCQIHKEVKVVKDPSDFEKFAPDGGCLKPCGYRMNCGHVCPRMCHPDDVEHATVTCRQKCGNRCTRDLHTCIKRCCDCKDGCPPCKISIKVPISICGHVTSIACGTPDNEIKCAEPCPKKLPCGHKCPNQCGYACVDRCTEKVEKLRHRCGHLIPLSCYMEPDDQFCTFKLKKMWPLCNHENETKCSVDPSVDPCRHKCDASLDCDHPCPGTCHECHQGRLHKLCDQDCDRILICGHACKAKCCMTACPPCERPCEQKCTHSRCSQPGKKAQGRTCGQPCPPCKEQCGWRCGTAPTDTIQSHDEVACSKMCHEVCDRPLCDMPCPIAKPYKKCDHRCPGLCGARCPPCRQCQPTRFPIDIISLEPYPDDARFLLLPECNHIVEVTDMDKWMHTDTTADDDGDDGSTNARNQRNEIVMKGCYQCKAPVLTVNRYNQLIKGKRADVEKVKIKMHGNKADLVQQRTDLLAMVRDANFSTDINMVSNETKNVLSTFVKNVVKVQNEHLTQQKMAQWSNFALILKEVAKNKKSIIQLFSSDDGQRNTVESVSALLPELGGLLKLWFRICMGIPASCITDTINQLFNDCLKRQLDHLTNTLRLIVERNGHLSEQYQTELFLEVQRFGPIIDLVRFCLELIEKKKDLKPRDAVNSGLLHRVRQYLPGNHDESSTSELGTCDDFQFVHRILFDLYGNRALTHELIEKVGMDLNQLKKRYESDLGVTELEKQDIVKAMGLGKGHWFKCGKGHIYAIGECGGAVVEAKCPECKDIIGGTGHSLVAGNQLAPEMDGARYPAFGDMANVHGPEV